MPSFSNSEAMWATVQGGILAARSSLLIMIQWLFVGAIALTLLRSVFYGILAIIQKVKFARKRYDANFHPPVSVILAAYNEERVILRTVEAVLASQYPEFEVIIVDDGSLDGTYELLLDKFQYNPSVRILQQPNMGKSAALNHAIAEARYEYVVALDADTLFLPTTIANLVRHFCDPRVAAVSGNAKVGNARNWISRFQSIEYVCGFNLDRRAQTLLNAVAVVPGAVGAWRKSAIIEAGGFPSHTVAEDTDLTLAIRRRGYRIEYDEEAIAYTEVPENISSLVRQRLRWAFGTLQSAWKHRDATFRRRYGTMGFITLPMIWLYQIMFAAISPLAEIALIIAAFTGHLQIALTYYAVLFGVELLTAILAYVLEGDSPKDLTLFLFQRILYPRLMLYVVGKSLLFAIGGRLMPWGSHVRTAAVKIGTKHLEQAFEAVG